MTRECCNFLKAIKQGFFYLLIVTLVHFLLRTKKEKKKTIFHLSHKAGMLPSYTRMPLGWSHALFSSFFSIAVKYFGWVSSHSSKTVFKHRHQWKKLTINIQRAARRRSVKTSHVQENQLIYVLINNFGLQSVGKKEAGFYLKWLRHFVECIFIYCTQIKISYFCSELKEKHYKETIKLTIKSIFFLIFRVNFYQKKCTIYIFF